jgi:tetratricopeptide (TPR) repeat protein
MSRYNPVKLNLNQEEEKMPLSPAQGRSFLEILLQESAENEGEELPADLFDETLGEFAIPNRFSKKRLKFLRFPKLKEMLDNLSHAEPEKPDGYVIMHNSSELSKKDLKEITTEVCKGRDDSEEFLNSISDKLKYFGRIGRKYNQSGKNIAAIAEDEAAFEAGIVKSITQDENIVSETLAELLVAQGQNSKALKMYKALILKFPEKSVYFAKKIEGLK